MRCQTYSRWMTQTALGGLSAAQEADLRAHVPHCAECSIELAAAGALVQEIDRRVAAMVSGEPSPGFEARLRASLAAKSAPSRWLAAPRWAFAGAGLAAAAVLAVLFAHDPVRDAARPLAAAGGAQVANQVTAPSNALETSSASWRTPSHRVAARVPQEKKGKVLEFEVLVPRGQLAAAMELNLVLSAGRVDGAQLATLAERAARPLELPRMEIAPLDDPGAVRTVPDGADNF
jgi:hypothetical protein